MLRALFACVLAVLIDAIASFYNTGSFVDKVAGFDRFP